MFFIISQEFSLYILYLDPVLYPTASLICQLFQTFRNSLLMTFIRAASILYGLNNNAIFKISLQTTFYYELSRKLPDRPKQKLAYSMAILFHRKYMGSIKNVHVYRFNVFRTKNWIKGEIVFQVKSYLVDGFFHPKTGFFFAISFADYKE